jgi:hypothetical protein
LGLGGFGKTEKKCKCMKRKAKMIILELGERIHLHEHIYLEDSTIVGIFPRKRMNADTLKSWILHSREYEN